MEGTLLISGGNFTRNTALSGDGGAICAPSVENITLSDVDFASNYAKDRGGAVALSMSKHTAMHRCHFSDNTGATGGGLWVGTGFGDTAITNSTFENNSAGA